MREAVRSNPGKRASGTMRSLPAPIAGLNFRDPISQLQPTDALILDNYFPGTGSLKLRKGYTAWATGLPGSVETLMEYAGAARQFFAGSGGAIYDITAGGAVGAPVVTGLTNARFIFTQFATTGGTYLIAVNGQDGVRTYDGTTWATQTVTGADPLTFRGVIPHQNRLWFWQTGSAKAFYLATGAIAGPVQEFDLGPQFSRGGTLAFASPVSFDSTGTGLTTSLMFVSNNGEMVLYRGTDPASAATWTFVGRYRIGAPTGDRAHHAFGGDIAILTEDGLISMNGIMNVGREQAQDVAVSAKIGKELIRQRRANPNAAGWQVFLYPTGTMALINAPQPGAATYHQWVVNTQTGAWGRFKGLNATTWGLFDNAAYFGGVGTVWAFDVTNADNGTAIVGEVKGGFSTFGKGSQKRFTMIRPVISANGDPQPGVSIDTDFRDRSPTDVVSVPTDDAVWGTAVWDQSTWGGSTSVRLAWTVTGAIGIAAAGRMKTATIGFEIELHGIDLVFEAATVPAL
jgi:hypothetical protein